MLVILNVGYIVWVSIENHREKKRNKLREAHQKRLDERAAEVQKMKDLEQALANNAVLDQS